MNNENANSADVHLIQRYTVAAVFTKGDWSEPERVIYESTLIYISTIWLSENLQMSYISGHSGYSTRQISHIVSVFFPEWTYNVCYLNKLKTYQVEKRKSDGRSMPLSQAQVSGIKLRATMRSECWGSVSGHEWKWTPIFCDLDRPLTHVDFFKKII